MIEVAHERLGNDPRIELVVADLERPLPLAHPVDAILSTATFHWIGDHDALFGNLATVLRPGGQLAAQCGGAGNIASIEAALSQMGGGFAGRKNFATPQQTRDRLLSAGFTDIECWLHAEPTALEPVDLEPYLETICLGEIVASMETKERAGFVAEVAGHLPAPVIDYVRLNIRARRTA